MNHTYNWVPNKYSQQAFLKPTEKELRYDNYFLQVAEVTAQLSRDPRTKVGSVIATPDYHIIATGYNGFPKQVREYESKWLPENKYKYVVDAEANAICQAASNGVSIDGCIMYCTLQPCSKCLGLIINSGISRVVYLIDNVLREVHNPEVSDELLSYLQVRTYTRLDKAESVIKLEEQYKSRAEELLKVA